jgi:hypothetical protein
MALAGLTLACAAGVWLAGARMIVKASAAGDASSARCGSAGEVSEEMASQAVAQRVPVIVELFTSEGCSSCPPADALLARLIRTQPVEGAEIIALKQHVDYWNRLGWVDRFSSSAFTARQSEYAAFFGSGSVYTPQMVVDGTQEFVGSSERKALAAIRRAAQAAKSPMRLSVDAAPAGEWKVRVEIEPWNSAGAERAVLYVALTEDEVRSEIARGENAGLSVTHQGMVRLLREAGEAKPGQRAGREVRLKIKPEWKRGALRVAAFVQGRDSRRILSAASALPHSEKANSGKQSSGE